MSLAPKYPELGTDAAGADTHATIINGIARECYSLSACCITHDAIISLDGGATDHLYVTAGVQLVFSGLAIPKGAVVTAKNAGAGSNYANLAVAVF